MSVQRARRLQLDRPDRGQASIRDDSRVHTLGRKSTPSCAHITEESGVDSHHDAGVEETAATTRPWSAGEATPDLESGHDQDEFPEAESPTSSGRHSTEATTLACWSGVRPSIGASERPHWCRIVQCRLSLQYHERVVNNSYCWSAMDRRFSSAVPAKTNSRASSTTSTT